MVRSTRFRILAVLLVLAGCATSPTGRRQLTLLPDSQMNQMGEQAFADLRKQQPRSNDPRTVNYVRCVAEAVAAEAQDETGVEQWDVEVFKDKSANAFALPGGNIGVHTGMLDVATDQHQLAAVLGHEVGHVIAEHGNERVSQGVVAQFGLAAIDQFILGGEDGGQSRGLILAALGVGTQVGLMAYSRTHESEADIIGLRLMARAGFDPRGSVELWQNMAKAGGGQPPEFLSTHPSHETRIEELRAHMDEAMVLFKRARAAGKRPDCR